MILISTFEIHHLVASIDVRGSIVLAESANLVLLVIHLNMLDLGAYRALITIPEQLFILIECLVLSGWVYAFECECKAQYKGLLNLLRSDRSLVVV